MRTRSEQASDAALLEQYRGMIRQLSWKAWLQLPASVKMWVGPEDMVSDAYVYILSVLKNNRYKKSRASRSTFTWVGVTNLFLNFAASHQTKKRYGWSIPLENIEWMGKPDPEIRNREALDALSRTYREASPDCRHQMQRWFGQEPVKARWSEKEQRIYREFALLAAKNRLTRDDCRELMRAGVCMQ